MNERILTPEEVEQIEGWAKMSTTYGWPISGLTTTLRAAWAERDRNDAERVDANWRERRAMEAFKRAEAERDSWHAEWDRQTKRYLSAEAEVAQLRERIADAENIMSADTMAYAKLSAESNGYREQAEATGKLIVESYGYQRNFEERWHAAKAEVAALRASRDQLQEALANAHVQVERYKAVATAAREAVADGWWDYAEDGTCIALSAALAALEEAKP